jgi:hypothetical protein
MDTISVSAWVKLTSSDSGSRLFTLAAATDSYLYLTINDGGTPAGISLRWSIPNGTEQSLTTPTQLPLNVWKHVTVVTSAALSQIYVDGKVVAQSTSGMTPAALGTHPSSVVGNSELNTAGIRGLVDEFQLYDGSLTEPEILTLAWPKTDYSIYRFDEASGDAIIDGSDRAKNGTLIGGSRVAGVFGGGIRLANASSGSATQYVDLGTGVLEGCTTAWTFASWYNAAAARYSAPIFIALESEASATTAVPFVRFLPAYQNGNDISLYWYVGGTTTRSAKTTFPLGLNQWRHIAVTRSLYDTYFYVDGTVVNPNGTAISISTQGGIAAALANAAQNYLGKNRTVGAGSDASLNGSLDDVLISCRAYKADEIKHLAYRP